MEPITSLHNHKLKFCGTRVGNRVVNYVSIPKCSSTIYRKHLYKNKRTFNIEPGDWFTVIRNPYTRCISGIKEYCKRFKRKSNLTVDDYNQHLAQMIDDISQYDEHLEPQLYFLNLLDEGIGVRLFDFDRDQPYAVAEWVGDPKLGSALDKPKHTDISVYDQELLETVVTKYYAEDLSLYHSIIRTDAPAYWFKG